MVDLPQTPLRLVTSQAPQTGISPAQVAEPYKELAGALNNAGEALSDVAVPFAEKAGLKAVTKDAQGNIQVEQAPIIGPAAAAYSRAVKVSALAQGEGDARRTDIELREKFRDNPAGYQAAAEAFTQKTVEQYAQAGPEVQVSLRRAIENTTTLTYRGLLNEKERLDLQRADASITAGVKSASDDALTLARGGDTGSQPFKDAVSKYETLLTEKTNNPRLAYPKEAADFDREKFYGEVAGQKFLHGIDQTYNNAPSRAEGAATALEQAKSILTDPDLKLDMNRRQAYYHQAVGEVRANEAIRKQDVSEARLAFQEISQQSYLGMEVRPEQVEKTAEAFRQAGDPGGAARTYASFSRKPLNDDFGRQPLDEQVKQLNGLHVTANTTPEGVISAIKGFEGFTPTAKADYKQYSIGYGTKGQPGETITPEAADIRLREEVGKARAIVEGVNPNAPEGVKAALTSLTYNAGADWTKQGLGDKIRAGDFEGAKSNFAQYNQAGGQVNPALVSRRAKELSWFGSGVPADTPASAMWEMDNRARTVNKAAWTQWNDLQKGYTEKGIVPSDASINSIVNAARATNDASLNETINAFTNRMDFARESARQGLPLQQSQIASMESAANQKLLSPGQQGVMKDLENRYTAITKGLAEDPIKTTVANFGDKFNAPAPLNLQDPAQLTAQLKYRGQIAQFASNNWQTKPVSALDTAEIHQVQAAIEQTADPKAKAQIFQAIAQGLPEDVRNATLAKLADKGGPSMAVSAAAGALMPSAPDIAQSIFRGQMAIKADKGFTPEQKEKAAYGTDLEKYLPSSAFTLAARTDPAGPMAIAHGAIEARYADLSAQSNDTSGKYNSTRLQQAVTDVTGGILSHNGGSLIAPQRGMTQREFDGVMYGINNNDLAGVTTLNGQPVNAEYLRGNATLESVAQGRYLVKLGKNAMAPIYAYQGAAGESPQKFILDLRGRAMSPSPKPYPGDVGQTP